MIILLIYVAIFVVAFFIVKTGREPSDQGSPISPR